MVSFAPNGHVRIGALAYVCVMNDMCIYVYCMCACTVPIHVGLYI